MLGFPQIDSERGLVEYWCKKLQEGNKLIPPVEVESDPIRENVQIDTVWNVERLEYISTLTKLMVFQSR
ncbi:hypothetical protein ACFL0M_13305 [Thermodesulfobacteriota bacterium]